MDEKKCIDHSISPSSRIQASSPSAKFRTTKSNDTEIQGSLCRKASAHEIEACSSVSSPESAERDNLLLRVKAYLEKVKELEFEQAELQQQLLASNAECSALQASVDELQKTNQTLADQNAVALETESSLKQQLSQLQKTNQALADQNAAALETESSLKQQLSQMTTKMEADPDRWKHSQQESCAGGELTHSSCQETIESLKEQVLLKSQELQELRTQLSFRGKENEYCRRVQDLIQKPVCPLALECNEVLSGQVEVVNISVADISLAGWLVQVSSPTKCIPTQNLFEFPLEFVLAAGCSARIVWSKTYQSDIFIDNNTFFWELNTEDMNRLDEFSIELVDPEGNISDCYNAQVRFNTSKKRSWSLPFNFQIDESVESGINVPSNKKANQARYQNGSQSKN